MIEVYDDILNTTEKDYIESFLTDNKFQWLLSTTSNHYSVESADTLKDGNENTREFVLLAHVFYLNKIINSPNYLISDFVFSKFLERTQQPFNELLRAKANLQIKTHITDRKIHSTPHIDFKESHKVLLYYVNDTDGNTVIFDRKRNDAKTRYNIVKEVEPKKGRFLLFDGDQYHAAKFPIDNDLRININYNFT
tara:strand:- start:150 stop:731 length:582 start_codon:yes stop_codon:yes gene_type:complete